ncbi:hypothetical protein O1611_g1452 [Lasiodiplodia mahajangana]|uniref:Uncharacterized protein n=1 Tax=Lasiodiplodia mahajangana TaxID=1108764 RepID=A0ACC2JXJ6_9PEZI|nr:hypothetical protein O1611_g1452 [Lasiodiplodia mahajangana]
MPVEGSWRMVEEGENDSFDTTIIRDAFEDDFVMSSEQSQLTSSSQEQASQDSIRDFADNADEDQVILRAPFQPSLYSTRHASADKERTPIPEFFMPTVGVGSPRRSSNRLSRAIRPVANDPPKVRRRAFRQESTDESCLDYSASPQMQRKSRTPIVAADRSNISHRLMSLLPEFLFDCLAWILSVASMVLHFLKWPVAIFVALYVAIGIANVGKAVITQSASASLQPICEIPGISFLDLTWCSRSPPVSSLRGKAQPLAFDELINAQSQFEQVLEVSAQGISLPLEMKRSESSVRDLRIVIKYSDLSGRDELVYEFDGYIETTRNIIDDLQSFNTHVGGTVDSVVGMNRWTSRYIDSVAANQETRSGVFPRSIKWILASIQPTTFDERGILNQYIEHSGFVLEKIERLIQEAQAILRLLGQADDHLQRIHEYVVRNGNAVQNEHSNVLSELWSLLGANNSRLRNLKAKLVLLERVDIQRKSAVVRLSNLVHDLGDIQTKVADLRDRIAAPGLLTDMTSIPLSVHVETINAGIERLEAARTRIRIQENERIQETLGRGKKVPMIDA